MKYGSWRPLFTSSHADITLLVSGRGPHEKTPIFETWKIETEKLCESYSNQFIQWTTDVWVFPLHEFEKTGHIWSAEMIDGFQPGEHGCFR